MSKLILVKIDTNWADEMDVGAFAIFKEEEWKLHEKYAKQVFKKHPSLPARIGIGSNQDMYFDSYKDYKKCYKATVISAKDAKYLCKTFNVKINTKENSSMIYSSFGNWILWDKSSLLEMLFDEDGKPYKHLNVF